MSARPPQWPADAGVGRWASEEERGLEMMTSGWWWQPGPLTNCCGCFSIRTGVYLLSLWNMVWGVAYIKVEQWSIPLLVQKLQKNREMYTELCTGPIVKQDQECDGRLRVMGRGETTLEFWQSWVPVYHAIGLFYILFSLAGWRAGYTNNPTFAKLFTMGFPAGFMIGVCESFVSPGDETPWHMVWSALWAMYCFKVAWSFYTRLRIAAQARQILAEGRGSGLIEEGGSGSLASRNSSGAGPSNSSSIELGHFNPQPS
eukprot:g16215.t1